MSNYKSDLIEYKGVSDYFPTCIKSKKEFNIDELVIIDNDIYISEVVKVTVDWSCEKIKRIETPKGISIDGIRLTGYKLLVDLYFDIRIEFIEQNDSSKVLSIKHDKFYLTSVILEEEEIDNRRNIATVFIENIISTILSEKEILIVISGVIGVE